MTKKTKYHGLCETCEHDPTCMLRRSTKLEIIQCEEFSIQPVAQKPNAIQSEESVDTVKAVNTVRMGLCVNCLNVAACGFPNARRGVLQCEEYLLDENGVVPPQSEYSISAA
jgi:hypothetical protein